MSIPIVIDCDPGHDDAIALLLALASPELDVKAVTTVAGNQSLEKTTRNALRVLELAGRLDLPVGAGAERPLARELRVADWIHGVSGLDGPELADPVGEVDPRHAIDLIADAVRGSDEPITLIPLGPLTNVALLLARYPAEGALLGRVVLMGGAIGLGNITPAAELNIWQDPEAARRVFSSGLGITMVGLDVTHKALLGPADADVLRERGRIGRFVAELLDFFASRNREIYELAGAPIHDAAAVAHVIRDDLVTTEHVAVSVDCSWELGRGRTLVDRWGRTGQKPNAMVGVDIDSGGFSTFLVERLSALSSRLGAA